MTVNTATTMKRHDLLPALTLTCMDGDTPVNLTAATAVRVIGVMGSATIFDRAPDSAPGSNGVVTMSWQAGDTAVSGTIKVEVEITWPNAKPQTFPVSGTCVVHVRDDLG